MRSLPLSPCTPHAAFAATHVAASAPLSSAVVAVSFLSVVCPARPHLSYIALLRPCITVLCAPARMHCSLLRRTRASSETQTEFCHVLQLRVCPRSPSCRHSCLSLFECCLECLCEGVLSCPLGSTVLFRACECRYTLHLHATNEQKTPLQSA